MSSPIDFISNYDLIRPFLLDMNWSELTKFARNGPIFHAHVRDHVQSYIKTMLTPFVPAKEQARFWDMMDTTGAAICGEFAMAILLSIPREIGLNDVCDIIAPRGQLTPAIDFLSSLGYDVIDPDDSDIVIKMNLSCNKIVCMSKKKLTEDNYLYFWLRESKHKDYVFTLLHEGTTTEMNAISAKWVISAYPTTTLRREGFINKRVVRRALNAPGLRERHAIRTISPAFDLTERCGSVCHFFKRSTIDWDGFDIFHWGKPGSDTTESNYAWRLGKKCINCCCEYYNITLLPPGPTFPIQDAFLTVDINMIILRDYTDVGEFSTSTWPAFHDHFAYYCQWFCTWFDLGAPVDFIRVLGESKAIIIGSIALFLVCPTNFLPNDMNLAVPADGDPSILRDFLRGRQYVSLLRSKTATTPSKPSSLHHVELLEHDASLRRIHVSFYNSFSVPGIVLDCHSTLLANCITAEAYFCFFPKTTLLRRGLRFQNTTTSEHAFSKYVSRGFILTTQSSLDNRNSEYLLKSSRTESILWIPLCTRTPNILPPYEWAIPLRPANAYNRLAEDGFVSTSVSDYGK